MSSSLAPECNEPKEYVDQTHPVIILLIMASRYDSCFLKWYSESAYFNKSLGVSEEMLTSMAQASCEGALRPMNASRY